MSLNIPVFAAAVQNTETSFFGELWAAFREACFSGRVSYPNLGLDGDSVITLNIVVIGLFIGLAIASFGTVFNKRVLGGFVRRILRAEALSPETAKTLAELGFEKSYVIRRNVRRGVNLRRVLRCREEEEYLAELEALRKEYEERSKTEDLPKFREKPFTVDPSEHHFYIPEEMKYMADVKFDSHGSSWGGAVVLSILMLILLVAALFALPYLLEWLDSWVASFSSLSSDEILA